MKFKIRFADQIVGFFVIVALVSLVFVIVMLGRSQRWFAKDNSYTTILPSAAGLGKNMALQYRGFAIGNIKSFYLTKDDEVEVLFSIHEEYKDRVKKGSMVELIVSPVGLGNQFLFHSGIGELLDDGAFVPLVGSAQAKELVRQGLAVELRHDDSISLLLNRVSSVFDELNTTLTQVNEAFISGNDATKIGQIANSVQKMVSGAEGLPQSVNQTIEEIRAELVPLLANVNEIVALANNPDNAVYQLLDSNGVVYSNLVSSLTSISDILENLDRTTAFIPAQLPQVAGLLMDLRATVKNAEDVLVALANNPLLRRGVPGKQESQSGGTSPRDIRF